MKATIEKETRTTAERPEPAQFIAPEVNICEVPDGYLLEAEMPGVNKDGLEITLEGTELTITGHRNHEPVSGEPLLRECQVVDFRRMFDLDPVIDTSRISAKMQQGVLTLTLPKSEKVKPRKIAVND